MLQTPILIVDKDQSHINRSAKALQDSGFTTVIAQFAKDAVELCRQHRPGIILIDPDFCDAHNDDLIDQIKTELPDCKVIVASRSASVTHAIKALRARVFDYFVKPLSEQTLLDAVTNAQSELHPGLSQARPFSDAPILNEIVGSSPSMKHISATIQAVSRSHVSVFISGEIGTGKKLTAEAIHALSAQSQGRFVTINCGSIPPNAIEAELFGRVSKDQPTQDRKIGAAEHAHGGVLYLDEVCALDPAMQARLLQLVETSTITPVGAVETTPVNTRIICGSSRDAHQEMQAGRFRADLYYRLHVVPLHLPPLRERGGDIIDITNVMIARFSNQENNPLRTLTSEAATCLLEYSWPGNIRELMNVIWNLVVIGGPDKIEAAHLPDVLHHGAQIPVLPPASQHIHATLKPSYEGMTLADVERDVIDAAISQANGSVPQAARTLDVSPSTLYRKLENWGRPPRGTRHR